MNSEKKILLATLFILISLIAAISLGRNVPHPGGEYTVTDNFADGGLRCPQFYVGLLADIHGSEHTQLSRGRGEMIDYLSARAEILENIFGSIEGITAMDEEEEYPISSLTDLEEYVQAKQAKDLNNYPYAVTPEDLAFREKYVKDGAEFLVSHRDNLFTYRLPVQEADLEEQLEIGREFAASLGIDSYLDFDAAVSSPQEIEGIIVPTRVDGLPLVAASRDFLLDRDEELWVLTFQGYPSQPMGLSIQKTAEEVIVRSLNTILPVAVNEEKQAIISAEEAVDTLRENLSSSIYIDDKYADGHSYEVVEIRLSYAAVWEDGEWLLEPVWAFIDQEDQAWDYCFLINGLTGQIYPAISQGYSQQLNPLK